jgi:tellurite methyltransferase
MLTATIKNFSGIIILLGAVIVASIFQDRPLSAAPARNDQSDKISYEAITGESADEDKSVWDAFYRNKNHASGQEAISYLKDQIHRVPPGLAFVPAMGEGRNAIFLAKKGFQVDGNDVSDVAIDKAMGEAKRHKVQIKPILADLNQYSIPEGTYDFILVSLFYSKSLMPKFKRSLKRGGYMMFYNRVQEPKPKKRTNSKTVEEPDDFRVNPNELREALKDFEIKHEREYIDHGYKVIGILARKP